MSNPNLRVRPKAKTGLVHDVTPASAGWSYVGFALHKLAEGEVAEGEAGTQELCLVLVSGKARISVDGVDLGELGERMSPFEGAPWAAYVPMGSEWVADATTALELAGCAAPSTDAPAPDWCPIASRYTPTRNAPIAMPVCCTKTQAP